MWRSMSRWRIGWYGSFWISIPVLFYWLCFGDPMPSATSVISFIMAFSVYGLLWIEN